MIIRSYDQLPTIQETKKELLSDGAVHLIGPRREALLALLLGPCISLFISAAVLAWMLLARRPEESLLFSLGPLLGVMASIVWMIYSLRLLQSPRVEAGIHCTREGVMTFALRRDAPYHEFVWSSCDGFVVKDESVFAKVSHTKQNKYLDDDFINEDGALLNVPSTVRDAEALCAWLEALRGALSHTQGSTTTAP